MCYIFIYYIVQPLFEIQNIYKTVIFSVTSKTVTQHTGCNSRCTHDTARPELDL